MFFTLFHKSSELFGKQQTKKSKKGGLRSQLKNKRDATHKMAFAIGT